VEMAQTVGRNTVVDGRPSGARPACASARVRGLLGAHSGRNADYRGEARRGGARDRDDRGDRGDRGDRADRGAERHGAHAARADHTARVGDRHAGAGQARGHPAAREHQAPARGFSDVAAGEHAARVEQRPAEARRDRSGRVADTDLPPTAAEPAAPAGHR